MLTLLLLLSQLLPPAPADELAVVTSAFTFTRDVDQVILGDTRAVTIDVIASHQGNPLDDKLPVITASVGSLSVNRSGPGRYRVQYLPPDSRFPQVAMISATTQVAKTSFIGLLAMPLWGKGLAAVKTKPGSDVEVVVKTAVGPLSFGPVRADKEGRAQVSLLLPPGVLAAATRSRDDAGNVSERPIDLGIPAFNRLSLLSLDRAVPADGTGVVRIVVLAADAQGAASLSPPSLQWRVADTEMTITATTIGSGMSMALVPVPATRALVLKAHAVGDGGQADVEVNLISGAAAKARLSGPSTLGIKDDRVMAVQCVVVDAADNIVPLDAVSIDVDRGRIDSIQRHPDGSSVLWWRLPDDDWVPGVATLQLRRSSSSVVVSQLSVVLVAAPVAVVINKPMAIPAPASPRKLLVAPFLGFTTGLGAFTSAGFTLGMLAPLTGFNDSMFVGLSSSFLPGLDSRGIAASALYAWRPELISWLGLHLGSGVGVVLTEQNSGAVDTAITAGVSAGPWIPLGPGAIELHADVDASYFIESSRPAVAVGLWLGYRLSM